jgi:exodeoxyribonuclease V
LSKISSLIESGFPYPPTVGQRHLFRLFDELMETRCQRSVLLIRGYAGTGKTTAVAGIVKSLTKLGFRSLLMAPTGRAAKVAAGYSEKKAFTIHKIIYRQTADKMSGEYAFSRQKNNHHRTVFIVDEASMIQEDPVSGNVLKDLLDYVYEQDTNKLVLIGDDAQLPPVKRQMGGALDTANLTGNYGLNIIDVTLTEVVRQEKDSGILANATILRKKIAKGPGIVKLPSGIFSDIQSVSSMDMEEKIGDAYRRYGPEGCIVICRSNRETVLFNRYIRQKILFRDEELEAGDSIMIVKNNYYWLGTDSVTGFLANGDFAGVMKISNQEERYGLKFADLTLQMTDYPEQEPFMAKAILNTLYDSTPALNEKDYFSLFEKVMNDQGESGLANKKKIIADDPYLNAIQIKFTYSITCHKAQGGQWPVIFVKHGFHQQGAWDVEYLRWLYTAISRATEMCYLVDFEL